MSINFQDLVKMTDEERDQVIDQIGFAGTLSREGFLTHDSNNEYIRLRSNAQSLITDPKHTNPEYIRGIAELISYQVFGSSDFVDQVTIDITGKL